MIRRSGAGAAPAREEALSGERSESAAERAHAQHQALRPILDETDGFLRGPRPPAGTVPARRWAQDLSGRLLRLHQELTEHFRDEEGSGLFEELAEHFPRASHRLARLRAEHDEMLASLRSLLADALVYAEGGEPRNPRLRSAGAALLARLGRHEHAETDYRLRLYNEDMGGGD